MTCILNQMARSKIMQLRLDSNTYNKMFGVTGYQLSTTTMKNRIKIFELRAGPNKELEYDVQFENVQLQFGDGYDVKMNFSMCVSAKLANSANTELLHDCLPFKLAANV